MASSSFVAADSSHHYLGSPLELYRGPSPSDLRGSPSGDLRRNQCASATVSPAGLLHTSDDVHRLEFSQVLVLDEEDSPHHHVEACPSPAPAVADNPNRPKDDPSSTLRRYEQRRFPLHFMLADPDAEAEYVAFSLEAYRWQLVAARVVAAFTVGMLFVGFAVQGAPVAPTTLVFLCLSCTTIVANALWAIIAGGSRPVAAQVVFGLGTALIVPGVWVQDRSVLTNEASSIAVLASYVVVIGTGLLPWSATFAIVVGTLLVPLLVHAVLRDSLLLRLTLLGFLCNTSINLILAVTQELMARRQFVDYQAMRIAVREQEERAAEQRALLEAIVPAHVVDELTVWMGEGYPAEWAVAHAFDRVAVAFIEAYRPLGWSTGGAANGAWYFAVQSTFDEVLSPFVGQGLFDKVKAIGDAVLVAGPFTQRSEAAAVPITGGSSGGEAKAGARGAAESGCARSAEGLLRLGAALASAAVAGAEGVAYRMGCHVGPVVAAVLGRSRLCYDVFGDVVNVASRVLRGVSGVKGAAVSGHLCLVGMSEMFAEMAGAGALWEGCPVTRHRIEAKGKGTLHVASLTF